MLDLDITAEELDCASDEEIEALYKLCDIQCIWPSRYMGDDSDSAFRFLTECWWTDNDADGTIDLVPPLEFVGDYCQLWTECFNSRQALIMEKSRRMIVSWMARGLETWTMGKARGSWLLIDQTHNSAAEHLWRCHFGLEKLRERKPDINIPAYETRGGLLTKEPTHIILANGSILTQGHQDSDSAQGKGKTGITLEEISKYRNPSAYWAQALLVTQGSSKGLGGWINGIANASPNADWHNIKGKINGRQFLGIEDRDWL